MSHEFILFWIGLFLIVLPVAVFVTYFVVKRKADKEAGNYQTMREAIIAINIELNQTQKQIAEAKLASKSELDETQKQLTEAKSQYAVIDAETKELQLLKKRSDEMHTAVEKNSKALNELLVSIENNKIDFQSSAKKLRDTMSKIDMYSRLDEFTDHGHFEMPEYLYKTSDRFAEEIKHVRGQQRELISTKQAVTYSEYIQLHPDMKQNKNILDGQVRLMLAAFNIDCDILISKVSPSNYARILDNIKNKADSLEKSAATLRCGFNIDYIELKYKECHLQYQFTLKKREEQDEQRLIREQIREEQLAIKEYDRAIAEAEKEERLYEDLLAQAREELKKSTEEDRAVAEQKIADLEIKLQEAEAKEQRAKSMAEQTRKGHVYVISNIGSFGEGIYKIGLTRRLDPMERVKELGDSSVPFIFDVHAIISVEDAPRIENLLHREFSNNRVNAVNLRKEFFRVDLHDIKSAVERIAGVEADFTMTILAKEYYETRRLRSDSEKE